MCIRDRAYIGNGPFKVDSWTHNNSIVLSKNENYWDADSVKLEKVTYSIMTDETTYYNAFSSGQLDAVTVTTKDYVDMFQGQDKTYAPYLLSLIHIYNLLIPNRKSSACRGIFSAVPGVFRWARPLLPGGRSGDKPHR